MKEKNILYTEPRSYFSREVRQKYRLGEFSPEAFLPRIQSVILGHAVGDALGVPVEFCTREQLSRHPVIDMQGFGTYTVPEGCWSDDTSMALATLDSLSQGKLDLKDMMDKFAKWYHRDWYTPTGKMFDVGNTCSTAIENYSLRKLPPEVCGLAGEHSNGNGALMRIHPAALWAWYCQTEAEWESTIDKVSALTHAHECSKLGCKIYTRVLFALLDCPKKASVRRSIKEAASCYAASPEYHRYARIFSPEFPRLKKEDIQSTGYIVHTLEAALWCLLNTKSYEECVLKAVNLGDDTDTTAAVAGGLAGALYGIDAIPQKWLSTLKKQEGIQTLCEISCENWRKTQIPPT